MTPEAPNLKLQKPAAQVEAEGDETITVEWEDLKIALPASVDDWDPKTLEEFERDHHITGLRLLVGTKRYDELAAEFKRRHGRTWKMRDIKSLGAVVAEHYGFDSAED